MSSLIYFMMCCRHPWYPWFWCMYTVPKTSRYDILGCGVQTSRWTDSPYYLCPQTDTSHFHTYIRLLSCFAHKPNSLVFLITSISPLFQNFLICICAKTCFQINIQQSSLYSSSLFSLHSCLCSIPLIFSLFFPLICQTPKFLLKSHWCTSCNISCSCAFFLLLFFFTFSFCL